MSAQMNMLVIQLVASRSPISVILTPTGSTTPIPPDIILPQTLFTEYAPIPPAAPLKRKQLDWPFIFDGDRKKYFSWAYQIKEKITIDADLIGTYRAIWYSINGRLNVKCQLTVSTFYKSGGVGNGYSPVEFIEYLDRTYRNV